MYLVSYNVNSPSVAMTLELQANGVEIPNESLTVIAGANADKTILLRVTESTTLGLFNDNGSEVSLQGAGLVVTKIA